MVKDLYSTTFKQRQYLYGWGKKAINGPKCFLTKLK